MDIDGLRGKALFSAKKFGFGEHAEDLAQEMLLKFLENKETRQTVDQAVIDAIREEFGNPNTAGYELRRARDNAIPVDELIDSLTLRGSIGETPTSALDFERYLEMFEDMERATICLVFKWGFSLKEVGHCFGVTESRVSQILKDILGRIRKKILE